MRKSFMDGPSLGDGDVDEGPRELVLPVARPYRPRPGVADGVDFEHILRFRAAPRDPDVISKLKCKKYVQIYTAISSEGWTTLPESSKRPLQTKEPNHAT